MWKINSLPIFLEVTLPKYTYSTFLQNDGHDVDIT